MLKNMFGGELKSKKDQKYLENILKTILFSTKEKQKTEACIKLLEVFENSLEIDIKFESLLDSIEDMAHCDSLLCKRIWLQIAMQIIKFRSDFRHKLFNKMMKIVFELEGKEIALKIRAIHCATNCCMNIQDLDVKILSEFLTFECLLNEEFQKDYLLVMILNLLKNEFSKISKFLIEFIINCMVLICFKRFTYLRELNDQSLKDEEKKFLKTVFQFFELYLNYIPLSEKKNSIIKNIVLIYCFFVNYERDYCWKNMKTFLTSESTKIVRFFLEIIYNEVSNVYSLTSFSTLNEYFFYDNDEEFGLTSYFDKYCFFENLYKIFLNKLGTDVNKILIKHKVKIIKGCVCYIGMSIWGYERIDTISIPYNIILSHFLKLINNSHRKIDQEIILCLRRLIKKYGETLTDEWNEIFKIIKSIITRDKSSLISDGNIPITSATQNSLRNLFEILDNIKMLVVCNKFFGKIEDFSQILDEFKSFQNESLILIKSKLKLNNYPNFIANLESVIIEYLLNSKSPRIRNYIIEIIRLNYSYGIKSGKKNIIENLILKHFSSILFSFDNNENLNFFSHLITEMCLLTSEMKFFDQIIRNLMSIHNQYKYLNSDFEKLKMIMNYQKNTLINTYSKLSSTFQSEKMICLNEKIYVFLKNTNKVDFQLLIILLDFFKNFAVNKDYELLLVDNREFYFKNMPSQVVINFKINKDDKKKFIYENLNKNKKLSNTNEIYQPYIVFKHNKLFDYLMNLINHDETHTSICEEVFDFLAIHLRTTFFFKGIKIEKLIQTIVCIDDIKKYATRKKFIDLLIEILVNTTYHLNNNYLMGTSTGNFYSTDGSNFTNQNLISNNQKISSQNCLNNIEITDENLKEKILNFSMSSLKSFINIMKSMVNTYKKQSISMLPNNFINTKQQMDSLSFISSVNINLITEIIDSTSSGKEKEVYITFKMVVNYIKKILNLISIYFSSIPETTEEKLNLFGIKNLNNFYSGNLKDTNLTNNLYINNGMPNKKINEYITCLLDILYDMKNLICFNQSLANSIFYLLLSIKDFLTQSGEENILKIIYLSLNIGWPIYENEILKLFSEYNFKVKKFDLEKVKPAEKYMKREYTNLLADMVCVYFIEKSCHGRVLINIFNSLFKNINSKGSSTFMRENIFLDLSKWQIHSKALRDNTGACNEYRSRIPRNAQIYLGKHSVIMIIPIDKTTAQLIVRNSISNLSITVNNYLDSFNYINDEQEVVDILSSEINISRRESYEMTPNHITRFSRLSNNSLAKEKKLEDSEDYSLRSMKLSFSEKDLREVCRDVKEDNIDSIKRPLIRNLSPEDIKNSKSAQHSPERFDYENKNSVNSLKEIKMINNSNIIMQHLTNLLCEQDFKFQLLEPNTHLEDYIKSLDNTPVYHTFNTGVIYVPSKSNVSEFDIFTYEGDVSTNYIKFLSSLGKLFSIKDNAHIYTGGLNKTGANGKYAIYYQDNIFQLLFHVSNLIKEEFKESKPDRDIRVQREMIFNKEEFKKKEHKIQLHNIRKKIIGNDYVNIVWLENPYQDFDPNLIISGAILVYLVVYPLTESHYLIKIKYNRRSRFNLIEKVPIYFPEDICIDSESLTKHLTKMSIQLNLLISYQLQKTVYKKIEIDQQINFNINHTGGNINLPGRGTGNMQTTLLNHIHFDTNIGQRFKEIERINNKFKNSLY